MCFCQLPFPTETSVRQNILTWAFFLILLSWWKKNLLPRFFTTRLHPRFIKRNFTLVNILFFFCFFSGLQVTLICIYEFSFFSLSTDNQPILQGHQLFNSAFSLAQFGILSKISRLLAHNRVSVAIWNEKINDETTRWPSCHSSYLSYQQFDMETRRRGQFYKKISLPDEWIPR